MRGIKTILNIRTLVIVAIGLVACFFAVRYQLKVHQHMVLFGLIISFPLVFSIQSAFKRRERALEYLAVFKAGCLAIEESFRMSKDLAIEKQGFIRQTIINASEGFFGYLQYKNAKQVDITLLFSQIPDFMFLHKDEMSTKAMFRITRYMRDVNFSIAYLMSLKTHRTVNIIRVFSNIFLGLFPILQACFLVGAFESMSYLVIYSISAFTSLILGTLLQIQEQLEDPFDQDGYDDIKLEEFGITQILKAHN